jgi:hypothetical protein
MVIMFIVQNILYGLLKLIWKRIVLGLSIFAILLAVSGVVIHHKLQASFSRWALGLREEKAIDNTIPGCKVNQPKYCWMNFFDNVADISGWLGENCKQIRMDNRQQVIHWTRIPNAQVIGYPRTEKWKYFPDSTLDQFQFRVLASAVDMENKWLDEKIKEKTEIVIKFRENPPNVKMKIAVDEELS